VSTNGLLSQHQQEAQRLWAKLSNTQQHRAHVLFGYMQAVGQNGATQIEIVRRLSNQGVTRQTFSTVKRNLRVALSMAEREALIYDPTEERYYLAADYEALRAYVAHRTKCVYSTWEATERGIAAFLSANPTDQRARRLLRRASRVSTALGRVAEIV
jgi:hypothetical protein